MDRESILRDLDIFAPDQWKKYAVRIPLNIPPENTPTEPAAKAPVEPAQDDLKPNVAPINAPNNTSFDALKQKMEAVGFTGVTLHDDKSTIICSCIAGHVNMVNIRDVGAAACKTCNFGVKFANLVRAEMETELGVKLSLLEGNKQVAIFITQDGKTKLICDKAKDKTAKIERDGDVTTYIIAPNMLSIVKIKQTIKSLIRPDDVAVRRTKYQRDELPVCPDMADKLKRDGANPTLVNMVVNVSDSKALYIENCLADGFLNNIYKS